MFAADRRPKDFQAKKNISMVPQEVTTSSCGFRLNRAIRSASAPAPNLKNVNILRVSRVIYETVCLSTPGGHFVLLSLKYWVFMSCGPKTNFGENICQREILSAIHEAQATLGQHRGNWDHPAKELVCGWLL